MSAAEDAANEALRRAARRLSVEDMRAALEAGATLREHAAPFCVLSQKPRPGQSPAELAAQQVAALRLLAGPIGFRTATSTLTLRIALLNDCEPAVTECLLQLGADTSAGLEDQRPLLHSVTRADNAMLLLAAGADATTATPGGVTPLHSIAAIGKFDLPLLRVLVDAGADVDAVASDDTTPLDLLLERGRDVGIERVSSLLEVGADPAAGVGWGVSSLEYIVERIGAREIVLAIVGSATDGGTFWPPLVPVLAAAFAWRRRRHMLLAIRGRSAAADDDGASATAVVGTGAAALGAVGGATGLITSAGTTSR